MARKPQQPRRRRNRRFIEIIGSESMEHRFTPVKDKRSAAAVTNRSSLPTIGILRISTKKKNGSLVAVSPYLS
jgi:hypothetical protein